MSIPDELFEKAEALARRPRKSRSQLYREALADHVAPGKPAAVTEALDALVAELETKRGDSIVEAARRMLTRSEW